MENVLEVLFPYIVILYLCDCITYVKINHVLLSSCFGKQFAIKSSGIRLAGLLPTSRAIISHNPPYLCTPGGVYARPDQVSSKGRLIRAEDFNFIRYDDLAQIELAGKSIKFNHSHKIDTPSSASARFQVEFIKKLKGLSPAERKEEIMRRLKDSFDLNTVNKVAKSHSSAFWIIKFLSSYLFMLVFIVLPIVLYSNLSQYANLNVLVACIVSVYFLLLAATFVTIGKIYGSDQDSRIYTLLSVIFSPVNAMHVTVYLTKHLYYSFNHLALAAQFTPPDAFKKLVRKELILMDHFAKKLGRQDWQFIWEYEKDLLYGLLEKRDISRREISSPPERQDQSAVSYCPLCLTEYSEKRPDCIDCEMALEEYRVP